MWKRNPDTCRDMIVLQRLEFLGLPLVCWTLSIYSAAPRPTLLLSFSSDLKPRKYSKWRFRLLQFPILCNFISDNLILEALRNSIFGVLTVQASLQQVQDKWQELLNVHSSMTFNAERVTLYQEVWPSRYFILKKKKKKDGNTGPQHCPVAHVALRTR